MSFDRYVHNDLKFFKIKKNIRLIVNYLLLVNIFLLNNGSPIVPSNKTFCQQAD